MISWILRLLVGRTVVRERAALAATETLIQRLKELGFSHAHRISRPVASAAVEEALRRAGETEKDGLPRSGKFLAELDIVALEIIAVFEGKTPVDTRIHTILAFHNLP